MLIQFQFNLVCEFNSKIIILCTMYLNIDIIWDFAMTLNKECIKYNKKQIGVFFCEEGKLYLDCKLATSAVHFSFLYLQFSIYINGCSIKNQLSRYNVRVNELPQNIQRRKGNWSFVVKSVSRASYYCSKNTLTKSSVFF